jgi:hypothetical protein
MTVHFGFIFISPLGFNYNMDASIIIYAFFFLKKIYKFCIVDIFGSIGKFIHYLDIFMLKRADNSSLMTVKWSWSVNPHALESSVTCLCRVIAFVMLQHYVVPTWRPS